MNTCQIKQTTKTLKFVPANNSSLKVVMLQQARETKLSLSPYCEKINFKLYTDAVECVCARVEAELLEALYIHYISLHYLDST